MQVPRFERSTLLPITALALALLFLESSHGNTPPSIETPSTISIRNDLAHMKKLISQADYGAALALAPAVDRKLRRENRPDLVVVLDRLRGGANLGNGNLREALRIMLPTRDQAIAHRDKRSLYSLDSNLAGIYLQMNNPERAQDFAEEAVEVEKVCGEHSVRPALVLASIYADKQPPDFPRAEALYSEAIGEAMEGRDFASAASGWHRLGASYFAANMPRRAEIAMTEAFRLTGLYHLPERDTLLRDLSNVLAARGEIRLASALMDEALASAPHTETLLWAFFKDRGRLRRMQGDQAGALSDFRKSLELARNVDVIPTDDDRVTFSSGLAEIYSDFIDAGNRLYLNNHDPKLGAEVFEAAEENRAAGLRALVPQPQGWRTRLPAEHQAVLKDLQTAELAALVHADSGANSSNDAQVRRLRARLRDIEFQASVEDGAKTAPALEMARLAMDEQTAVLAFHLGPETSWIWSMTKESFHLHQLPKSIKLARDARRFRESIRGRTLDGPETGSELGRKLLGSLPPEVLQKHRWIVVLDQDLFQLPLAALRLNGRYLIEDHALLVTPSLRLLEPAGKKSRYDGALAAIGDAIYNVADPRWHRESPWHHAFEWSGTVTASNSFALARLNGSANEVQTALATWGRGTVRTGEKATKAGWQQTLESEPAILHLATHVIRTKEYGSGVIVLGLNRRGEPDFVGMRDILLHPVKTELVVMSGCASGDAQALPASGLMGLTRAWMGAGATEVLATMWPELDDGGPFFASFYKNLRENPELGATEALRRTQMEMLSSGTFRSNPEYWASYFLVGRV
jgi:CHAT domain-containing protein